jgi:hypothetical protein
MLLLGACVGALGLVKVNIGVFALLSTAVACAATYPALGAWKRSRLAAELMFVAVPFVLVARDLGQSESRSFALHVSIAALAAVVALRGLQPDRSRDWRELRWLLGGVGGAAAMICVGIIAAGTSPGGLVEGVVIDPSKLPSVLGVGGPRIPAGVLVLDVFALAACLGWRRLSAQGRLDGAAWRVAAPLSSIGVGVLVGLTAAQVSIPLLGADPGAGGPTADRFLPLALAWIALIPPRAADQGMAFAGRLLVALAVLQALHAYPVAGTQTQWGSFLLVPVGAFCVANGLRDLPLLATAQRARRSLILAAGVIPLAMAWWALDQAVLGRLEDGREGYRAGVPIALAGTGSIHFDARHVRIYRRVSEAIIDDCRTFLSLPGLNSFYLWTEIDPPTLLNTTQWMYLFDRDTERRVVQQSERVDGLCLLKSPMVLRFWTGDDPPPNGPLLRFMREEFKPIYRFGGYELLRRASG